MPVLPYYSEKLALNFLVQETTTTLCALSDKAWQNHIQMPFIHQRNTNGTRLAVLLTCFDEVASGSSRNVSKQVEPRDLQEKALEDLSLNCLLL